jgi:hypothetical protein
MCYFLNFQTTLDHEKKNKLSDGGKKLVLVPLFFLRGG